jgi:hypothetical protein
VALLEITSLIGWVSGWQSPVSSSCSTATVPQKPARSLMPALLAIVLPDRPAPASGWSWSGRPAEGERVDQQEHGDDADNDREAAAEVILR